MIKTTNLETSKKLRDAGFPQDTWFHRTIEDDLLVSGVSPSCYKYYYASPTTDELLKRMTNVKILAYSDEQSDTQKYLMDLYRDPNRLADCWLWLKKEGLIK